MRREERFAAAMTAITRRLPFGLSRVVAPNVTGYIIINLCTFCVDLALLALFHSSLKLPLPVSVTLSFGTAGIISYIANRVLNFRSHAAVGGQFALFVAAEVSNYLIFVLGVTDALAAAGLYYELARIIAACCEGVYLYCWMRWLVFRDTLGRPAPEPAVTAEPAQTAELAETAEPAGPASQEQTAPTTISRYGSDA
ncbi:MAG TPA: GtrA family protein [Trebonia sp.]|jgi:putative flippase GtrA|nr:GtrA family protein [Trebonia sp.]